MTRVDEIPPAPHGFSAQLWKQFSEVGFLTITGALSDDEVALMTAAVTSTRRAMSSAIVTKDSRFVELIDHPSHVGFVYDVYGEMLKLLRAECFQREPGAEFRNSWHYDGPRLVPFQTFGDEIPFRIKVGYWLTPLDSDGMGNLMYVPGSHRWQEIPEYHTHDDRVDQVSLRVNPGDMTLMWGGLWHRVGENRSNTTRLNIFLEYGPSWFVSSNVMPADSVSDDQLTRSRRIILRDYEHPNCLVKIPPADVPLFRRVGETGAGDSRRTVVPEHLRKCPTRLEEGLR